MIMGVGGEKVPMMDGMRILWMCIGFILKMIIQSCGGRILLDGSPLRSFRFGCRVCVCVVGVGEDAGGHGMMLHFQDG